MKVLFLFVFFSGLAISAFSVDLQIAEDSLEIYHREMSLTHSDAVKDSLSSLMKVLFVSTFSDPKTFDYPFSKLKFSTMKSSDNRIRMFNWNIPYEDGTHRYQCFVLVREKKGEFYWWKELTDSMKESEKMENKFFTDDKWLGALYYEIIPMDKKNKESYTLLGWDGKDRLTTRKIIDVMTISGKKIKFGAGIFKGDDGTKKRVIMEYSDEVSSSVKYFSRKKCIVVDHLSPKNPNMIGIYADYGPDGSYDMYTLVKGKWEKSDNVDVKQFTEDDNKPFMNPGK
ncbi:MAG: hypothetical protein ACKVOK_03840 [Flavobacteriales bacterium]